MQLWGTTAATCRAHAALRAQCQWHSLGRLLFIPHLFPLPTDGTHTSSSPITAHHPLVPKQGLEKVYRRVLKALISGSFHS